MKSSCFQLYKTNFVLYLHHKCLKLFVHKAVRKDLTGMTVVKPDPVAIIFAVAFHGIICVVTLRHLKIRIYHNLKHQKYKTQATQIN